MVGRQVAGGDFTPPSCPPPARSSLRGGTRREGTSRRAPGSAERSRSSRCRARHTAGRCRPGTRGSHRYTSPHPTRSTADPGHRRGAAEEAEAAVVVAVAVVKAAAKAAGPVEAQAAGPAEAQEEARAEDPEAQAVEAVRAEAGHRRCPESLHRRQYRRRPHRWRCRRRPGCAGPRCRGSSCTRGSARTAPLRGATGGTASATGTACWVARQGQYGQRMLACPPLRAGLTKFLRENRTADRATRSRPREPQSGRVPRRCASINFDTLD